MFGAAAASRGEGAGEGRRGGGEGGEGRRGCRNAQYNIVICTGLTHSLVETLIKCLYMLILTIYNCRISDMRQQPRAMMNDGRMVND